MAKKLHRLGSYPSFMKRAVTLGAREAKIVKASSVVTAEWVRLKCQFGCDGFGGCLTCPPNSPTPQQTRRMLGEYRYALLVHGDDNSEIHTIVTALEKEIFLKGFHKAFAMSSGPCNLCERCAESCRHSERARPSMEACGIDVFSTARRNGFPIEVLKDVRCRGNYYGLVLIE